MSCPFQKVEKTIDGKDCKKKSCKVTGGECQFETSESQTTCDIREAFKDL